MNNYLLDIDRRKFLTFGTISIFLPMTACQNKEENQMLDNSQSKESKSYPTLTLPNFSVENLHQKLDVLLQTYESKKILTDAHLLPSLSKNELLEQCKWFPAPVPEEIVALYAWRGGQTSKNADSHPFWFRDNIFHDIQTAKTEYEMMIQHSIFGKEDEYLKSCFPFASFEGSVYAIPSGEHPFNPSLKHPVISIFEGINVFYYSLETLVETCIEWVQHPDYDVEYYALDPKLEHQIWDKHNPNIFK